MKNHNDVIAALAAANTTPPVAPQDRGALDWADTEWDFDSLFDDPDPDVDVGQLTEFEVSKLLRGVRSRKHEVERLEAYKKKLLEQIENTVGAKIKKVEEQSEVRRAAIRLWLERNSKKSISFPDIGRLTSTEKAEFSYDEDLILDYVRTNSWDVIKKKETLDKTAFKKMVEAKNVVVPGFEVKINKSTTFTES